MGCRGETPAGGGGGEGKPCWGGPTPHTPFSQISWDCYSQLVSTNLRCYLDVSMKEKFEPLSDGNIAVSLPNNMFKLQELEAYTIEAFQQEGLKHVESQMKSKGRGQFPLDHPEFGRKAWFSNGWECEILTPTGSFWQKGKLRMKVTYEFCPEGLGADESELRDFRSTNGSTEDSTWPPQPIH
jgi:hypothetical protein